MSLLEQVPGRKFAMARIPWRYLRYAGASAVALGCDLAAFGALVFAGMTAAPAAAIGYAAGIVVHWLVSTAFVFADRTAAVGTRERSTQRTAFVLSALFGLVVTWIVVAIATFLGAPALLAKLFAIAASFQSVWLVRRHFVFRD